MLMSSKTTDYCHSSHKADSFNMTPIIDIVFLLIIFFLVVSQLIEAENFDVNVPANCQFARISGRDRRQVTTVTVIKPDKSGAEFAVGCEKNITSDNADLISRLAELINVRIKDLAPEDRIVTLRIDKDVHFAQAQYALAGIAQSNAASMKLAVLKNKRVEPQ